MTILRSKWSTFSWLSVALIFVSAWKPLQCFVHHSSYSSSSYSSSIATPRTRSAEKFHTFGEIHHHRQEGGRSSNRPLFASQQRTTTTNVDNNYRGQRQRRRMGQVSTTTNLSSSMERFLTETLIQWEDSAIINNNNNKQSVRSSQQLLLATLVIAAAVVTTTTSIEDIVTFPALLRIPQNVMPNVDPRYFIAGGLCAATSHGITTPIDVIKTRIQANPQLLLSNDGDNSNNNNDLSLGDGKGKSNGGILKAATKILEQDGVSALLAGLGPTVIGYGLEGAAKFGLYESLKPEMVKLLQNVNMMEGSISSNPTIPYLLASVIAGAVASVMLCPMEKTRIRLVTDSEFFASNNLLTGIPQIIQESGISSLFSGLQAMLSKQVPYTLAKQVSFDTIAAGLYAFVSTAALSMGNTNFSIDGNVKMEVSLTAAFLASILACILSHPGDVLLTTMYKDSSSSGSGSNKQKAFREIIAEIYNEKGLQGFVSGISARFVHVGAIITTQLVLYDTIKQALGLPATGT